MRKTLKLSLYSFVIFFMTFVSAFAQSYDIKIHNRVEHPPYAEPTNVDAGPDVGNILNVHYFPGLIDYQRGNYNGSKQQMDYFLARPHYTQMNPQQREFFSHGHYIRGMIYLYHASGRGRLVLAKKDFEQSIRWNSKNYTSYLQLSRVLSTAGFSDKALSILQKVLDLNPDKAIGKIIREEMDRLKSEK